MSAMVREGQWENTTHAHIPTTSGMAWDTPDGTWAGWSEVHPTFLRKAHNFLSAPPPKGGFLNAVMAAGKSERKGKRDRRW